MPPAAMLATMLLRGHCFAALRFLFATVAIDTPSFLIRYADIFNAYFTLRHADACLRYAIPPPRHYALRPLSPLLMLRFDYRAMLPCHTC